MHIHHFFSSAVCIFIVGCASSTRNAAAVPMGAAATNVVVADAGGEPGWVKRGSAAVKGDGGRLFYGVGAAGGISNPSLLRSTADNRARAELAKVFQTFSASLMHDYANSDGAQNVEQAVKTLSSMSLEGVTITDRYVARDGTLYSLASLDLATMGPAIAKAKAAGLVKSEVQPVTLDDMFDKSSRKEVASPPAVAQGQAAAPPTRMDGASAPTVTGGKPAWVDGEDVRFPNKTYLCGVGMAPERTAAENGGYAALSRIFAAHVASTSQDFMGAYAKTGGPDLNVQSSESLTKVSTEALLRGVRIMEVWNGPQNTTYTLACLERAKAIETLRAEMQNDDQKAATYLANAQRMDKTSRVRELSRAMDTILSREAANSQVRILDLNGIGISGPYAPADIASALEAALEALKVGVRAQGPFDSDFRGALIQGLTERGYKVSDLANEPATGMDVLVSATIRVEDAGQGTQSASGMVFARGVVQVEVKNVAENKILASFNESRKEGSRSKDEAQRRAVRNLVGQIVNDVGGKIDATMKGK